jgi:hypothetical protein
VGCCFTTPRSVAQPPDALFISSPVRIEADRTAQDVVRQLPRNGFALDVSAFPSDLR